jgi:hypothetical protein
VIPHSFRSATPNAFSYPGDGDSSFLSNTGTPNNTVSNRKQILNTQNCRNIKSHKVNARLPDLMCKGWKDESQKPKSPSFRGPLPDLQHSL